MKETNQFDKPENLIRKIEECWSLHHSKTGTLIQLPFTFNQTNLMKKFFKFSLLWHYAVALSDTYAISWIPSIDYGLTCKGYISVEHLSNEYIDAMDVPYINNKEDIFKNLIASVLAFHNEWDYGLQGWNCEHYARLVTCNSPMSYQVAENFLGRFRFPPDGNENAYRPEALERLNKYL